MNKTYLSFARWGTVALCWLAAGHSSLSQTFKAEGRLVWSNPARPEIKSSLRTFTAYFHDEQWLIRMHETDVTSPLAYHEMAFDGTQRTSITLIRPEKVGPKSINVGSGIIHRLRMPELDSSFAAPIWVGFGGARHFRSLTNNLISPMWINPPTRRVARYEPTGEWEFSKQSPGFLESACFYETAGWLAAPYDEGFLRARHQVTAWTNIGGMIFPLRWELQDYHPKSRVVGGKSIVEADNRDDTRPEVLFRVEVSRIETGIRLPRYQAKPTGPVIVVDQRTAPPREHLASPETFPLEDATQRHRFPAR